MSKPDAAAQRALDENTARNAAMLDKYPDMELHEDDHLTDKACPNCGERDSITISATSDFDIYPDGTDQNGDVEWTDDSPCKCRACSHGGTVGEFTFTGLDEDLAARKEEGGK